MKSKGLALILVGLILLGAFSGGKAEEKAEEFAYVHTEGVFDRLNVRMTPSDEFAANYKLYNGAKVRVEQRENGWASILCGEAEDLAPIRGYVREEYLESAPGEGTPLPRIRVGKDAFYMPNIGWYYTWPLHEEDVIPVGSELTVLAVKGNYVATDSTANFDAFYVETDDGQRYWLRNMADFAIEVLNPLGYTAKTTDSVRMRQAADTGSKALYTLNANAQVEILLRGEGWTMVKYRGQTGYIMSRYLAFPADVNE